MHQRHRQAFHGSTECKKKQECCIIFVHLFDVRRVCSAVLIFVIQYRQTWLYRFYYIQEIKIFKEETFWLLLFCRQSQPVDRCHKRPDAGQRPRKDGLIQLLRKEQEVSDICVVSGEPMVRVRVRPVVVGNVSPTISSLRNRFSYVKGQHVRSPTSIPF